MEQDRDNSQGDAVIGRLIAAAGPGTTASPAARQRIYAAARTRWDETVSERERNALRQRTTRLRVFGMAASVAAAAATIWLLQGPTTRSGDSMALAAIAQASGNAALVRDDRRLAIGAAGARPDVSAGDTLRTGPDGQVALALASGLALRVNVDSEIVFTDPEHLNLIAGTIYLDTGLGNDAGLEVLTPLGTVAHLGTQYEVHVGDAALRVRVREGAIAYTGSVGRLTGAAGQQLDIARDGQTAVTTIAADDTAWDWAETLAVLAPADAYVIDAVVAWAARELGLTLQYADTQTQTRWATATLPNLAGMNPEEVLQVVEATTLATLTVGNGRLTVGN